MADEIEKRIKEKPRKNKGYLSPWVPPPLSLNIDVWDKHRSKIRERGVVAGFLLAT